MEEFLKILIQFFDQNNIPYMLSGSMAMSVYTVSRYTKDFDFIVHLSPSDIARLKDFFKEGYYFDEDSIAEAIKQKGMFNIIDHASNYKADFIMLRDDEFEQVLGFVAHACLSGITAFSIQNNRLTRLVPSSN